jgi:hypothetical protein
MCQKIEQINQKLDINMSNPMSKRTVILASFSVICPKCKHRSIIEAKKALKFKLGKCSNCHIKTWLRIEGKVKQFGKNDQFAKISWFNSPFAQFWLNIEGNQ